MTMTQEDKLALDAYNEESKKNVEADIAAMDAVLEDGKVETTQESAEPETDIFTGEPIEEVKDQRVGEAGPDDLVEEVRKAAGKQEGTEEAIEEGEYDFSFINDLARQALERGMQVPTQPV